MTPLPLVLRAEAVGEDHRDGNDMPPEIADYEAGRVADDYYRTGERP